MSSEFRDVDIESYRLPNGLTIAQYVRVRVQKRKQKMLLKAKETPAEKRARRLAKREAKEQNRKRESGWEELLGYSNTDNPFGDSKLFETFVWQKRVVKQKMEEALKTKLSVASESPRPRDKRSAKHAQKSNSESSSKRNAECFTEEELHDLQTRKRQETRVELEKVRKRREEREREHALRENEIESEQREKEASFYRVWEAQEDKFHLEQAKVRSRIRIADGRAKPIDLLAKYVAAEDDDTLAVEMHEPYTYLFGLSINDLEDLLEDIKIYVQLEEGKNADFWKDITIIVEDELGKLRKLDTALPEHAAEGRRDAIHNDAVRDEIENMFRGKSAEQLRMLELQIATKLAQRTDQSAATTLDTAYWESILQQLRARIARSRLRERHAEMLRNRLERLRNEQSLINQLSQEASDADQPKQEPDADGEKKPLFRVPAPVATDTEQQHTSDTIDLTDYDAAIYSPRLLSADELDLDSVIYDPDDDAQKLEFMRDALLGRTRTPSDKHGTLPGATQHGTTALGAESEQNEEFMRKARAGMNDEEVQLGVGAEVSLGEQTFLWSDKYRPRKPRYFNRVHTGYEWNKYNQTHYDTDNPPPKIVQGYKFNIFYPDLIDKTKLPTYTLTTSGEQKEFAVIRFVAGPPYEDIAFNIVNREWDTRTYRGFRCQFVNNIFQLWFHFKRYRYRR